MNLKDSELPGLVFHHIGVLVENIDDSILHYSEIFGKKNISGIVNESSQKVKTCLVKISPETYIELVQPTHSDSSVNNLLKKRISYYHLAYKVKNIQRAVDRLCALNYKPLEYFDSCTFGGKKCIFLFTPEAHLIELIEEE